MTKRDPNALWKQPVIAYDDVGSQVIGPNDRVDASTQQPTGQFGGMFMGGLRRSGQINQPGYAESTVGDIGGIHDLVDPTTPRRNRGMEFRDYIISAIAVGACQCAFGVHECLVAGDWTTLVGVGWEHGPDFIWKTFLKDAPGNGLVNRTVRQIASPYLGNELHEMGCIIDGWSKEITWTVDGVAFDKFAPLVPLDAFGGTAALTMLKLRWRAFAPGTNPASDATIYSKSAGLSVPILTLRECGTGV